MRVAINKRGQGLYLTAEGIQKYIGDPRTKHLFLKNEEYIKNNILHSIRLQEYFCIPFTDIGLPENRIDRSDPILIEYVENFSKSGLPFYELSIVEIPDDVQYYIGSVPPRTEIIIENHRTWE